MWILPLVGYAGTITGFGFLTLAIASGLYLSELVEEHTVMVQRLLKRLIHTVFGIQAALWLVDGFPSWPTALGLAAHIVYLGSLRHFPIVKLSDLLLWLACVLVLADHFLWYSHFTSSETSINHRQSYYEKFDGPTFTITASYFGLCVWFKSVLALRQPLSRRQYTTHHRDRAFAWLLWKSQAPEHGQDPCRSFERCYQSNCWFQ